MADYISTGTGTTGMDLRVCPTCKGTGINPVATYLACPKCNGETVVRSTAAAFSGERQS